ncbi:unnamed protein product, partial [marine sediment metagenome]
PRETREAGAADWRNHFGTGPFILKDWVEGSHAIYDRNPNYWDTETINGKEYPIPFIDQLVFPWILDRSTQIAALRTGQLDLMPCVEHKYKDSLIATCPDLMYRPYAIGQAMEIAFMHGTPGGEPGPLPVEPFTDIRVRKAMSMAIDRQALLDALYGGEGHMVSWPVSFNYGPLMYTPLEELPPELAEWHKYDPEAAKQLLAETAYPNGFKTEMIFRAAGELERDTASMVVDYWDKHLNIECELKSMEDTALTDTIRSNAYLQLYCGM